MRQWTKRRAELAVAAIKKQILRRVRRELRGIERIMAGHDTATARASPISADGGREVGWLVENGQSGEELRYRTIVQGLPAWTADHNEAIRFARRVDAEKFAAEDEDAWRIAEHIWDAPNNERAAPREPKKWCSYCKVDTHNDMECWCTRPANWKPGERGLIMPDLSPAAPTNAAQNGLPARAAAPIDGLGMLKRTAPLAPGPIATDSEQYGVSRSAAAPTVEGLAEELETKGARCVQLCNEMNGLEAKFQKGEATNHQCNEARAAYHRARMRFGEILLNRTDEIIAALRTRASAL